MLHKLHRKCIPALFNLFHFSFLTPHDVNHHLHIPHPGRVQHYRAEALPFVPTEIKTQIRFPKAYAMSAPSLRYLDQVKGEIDGFMKDRV